MKKKMITNTIIVSPVAYNMELRISKLCPVVDGDSFNFNPFTQLGDLKARQLGQTFVELEFGKPIPHQEPKANRKTTYLERD